MLSRLKTRVFAVVTGPLLLAGFTVVVVAVTSGPASGDGNGTAKRKTVRLPHPDAGPLPDDNGENVGTSDAGFRFTRTPPDPDPPLSSAAQWIFDLRYQQGDIFLVDTRALDVGTPRATPRVMGRFALELYDRAVLIERVRFDFPFLGAPAARPTGPIALDKHVTSTIGVVFPRVARGTRLELVDRSTEERWQLPWPAREQISADASR